MFNDRQDVFEYPGEKPDWKYPKYVKLHTKKPRGETTIDSYNEELTRQNLKFQAAIDDDD